MLDRCEIRRISRNKQKFIHVIMSKEDRIGALDILAVLFIALKLIGVIDWSWEYITTLFWGGIVLSLVVVGIAILITFIISLFD